MPDWKLALRERLAGLALSGAREAEIVEELSAHLEDRYTELVADGSTPEAAHRQALQELRDGDLLTRGIGGLRQARMPEELPAGAPRSRLLADLGRDLRHGLRGLVRRPGLTLAAVFTLALGIGANTTIFSLVNATLLRRLPVADSSQLFYLENGPSGSGTFSYPEFAELRDGPEALDGIVAWGGIAASLGVDGDTDLATGAIVTGNFFEVLGVPAALGRALAPSDDVTPGAHPVLVISHGLWQRRFGGRPDVVGREILLNGHAFTILGVTPRAFDGPQLGVVRDLFVPMMMQAVVRPPRAGFSGEMSPDLLHVRSSRWLSALGRLKPQVTRQQAEAALSTLATSIDRATDAAAPPHPIVAHPVDDGVPGQRAQMVPVATLLLCVAGAVLFIACANVANLLLARAAARQREVAIRLAIGASRSRLVRQLLTESVLLALFGGALGVGLAQAAVSGFRAAPPPHGALPVTIDFTIDAHVLSFSLALSLVTGILFGLAPALRGSRPSLVPALKDESFVPDERARRFNLRKALVVGEVAVSLALLVAAGLFLRSLERAHAVDPGFDADRLLNAPLNVDLLRYTRAQGREFYARVVERVGSLPGVESATVARISVFHPRGGSVRRLLIEGREDPNARAGIEGEGAASRLGSVSANVVGPDYFRTLGIGLVHGRTVSAQDGETDPPIAVVNREFVRTHFPHEEPIGKRVNVSGPQGPWREIVGVVADCKYRTLWEERTPMVYIPLAQNHETGVTLHVRTRLDPATLIPAVRREVQSVEPNLPVPDIEPMTHTIGATLYAARMGAALLSVFGGLALLLAAIGVYGVMAFSVSRRTRELGIRMALGARAHEVQALVIRDGMRLVALGIALGLAGAALGTRFLAGLLSGVGTADPTTFVSVPVILATVALLACYVPARRATKVDPIEALRYN